MPPRSASVQMWCIIVGHPVSSEIEHNCTSHRINYVHQHAVNILIGAKCAIYVEIPLRLLGSNRESCKMYGFTPPKPLRRDWSAI